MDPAYEDPCAVRALEVWIRDQGGFISDAVAVRVRNTGANAPADFEAASRGVFAGANGLLPGTDVCRLPEKLLITEARARDAMPFGEALGIAAEQLQPQSAGLILLAAYLLWDGAKNVVGRTESSLDKERQCRSFHWPYYRALTQDLSYLPALWAADDVMQHRLRGSRLQARLRAKRHMLGLEFALLQSYAPDLSSTTFDDYLWARGVVSSRAYALQIRGDVALRCLVPLADLLNHGGRGQTAVRYAFDDMDGSGQSGSFLMRASEDGVGPHCEILQSYGPSKNNAALFLDYGFVLVPTSMAAGVATSSDRLTGDAEATIAVRLPQAVEGDSDKKKACDSRLRLWRAARRPPTGVAVVDVKLASCGPLFSLLRVACASSEDLRAIVESGATDAHAVVFPVSEVLERRALDQLSETLSAALARFPASENVAEGSLSTDAARAPISVDIVGSAVDARVWGPHWQSAAVDCCAVVVEEEKEVLCFYLRLAELAVARLDMGAAGCKYDEGAWLASLPDAARVHAKDYLDLVMCVCAA